MNPNSKVIEPSTERPSYYGPCQEIAIYVRDLLKCEYAFVAVGGNDSICINGFAGPDSDTSGDLVSTVLSGLRDWGPVVVDDSRLIATPVSSCGQMVGALIGYSTKPGTFTTDDLNKLMTYAPVAAAILANTTSETTGASFTADALLHFSRLITIGELSACFAHEVTNPLTLIRGHLRFVEENLTEDSALRAHFDVIDRASRRIEEMAKRMLDFSRKRPRRTSQADFAEVISDALRLVQPYLRSKFVDVKVNLDQLPLIDLDRWQMVQAFVNLFQNATDAMAEVDRRALSIDGRVENQEIRIAVSDTGNGIKAENISKIFEPFFTTKGDRGTGLGLYIAKQVIGEHRGTVSVETSERGTSFNISLPL